MSAPYLGDYAAGETVHFMWNSNDSNGASITRSTDGTISVYKDNNDTQTTTGVTDSENVDGLTGVHRCVIATSDGFYTAQTDFMVVLSGATIDTRTVNAVLAHFSIENRSALRPTTAGRTLAVESDGMAHADLKEIAGATVSTSSAQLGVNVVNAGGTAWASGAITANAIATGAIDADALAADAGAELADAFLDRDMSTGTDSGSTTVRTPRQALRVLRNKVEIAAGTMTVTKEDDATSSWTAAVTTTAGDPISAVDPAGP